MTPALKLSTTYVGTALAHNHGAKTVVYPGQPFIGVEMKIPELRTVSDELAIMRSFHQILTFNNRVSLWQNLHGERSHFSSFILKIDDRYRFMQFAPKKNHFILNSRQPLYLYSQRRCTILKSTITFNSSFKVEIEWPQEIMTIELRKTPRVVYTHKDGAFVEFIKSSTQLKEQKSFKKPIIDHSPEGFAFQLSHYDAQIFHRDDPISITSLPTHNTQQFGRIHYITEVPAKSQYPSHIRVGVKFEPVTNV